MPKTKKQSVKVVRAELPTLYVDGVSFAMRTDQPVVVNEFRVTATDGSYSKEAVCKIAVTVRDFKRMIDLWCRQLNYMPDMGEPEVKKAKAPR